MKDLRTEQQDGGVHKLEFAGHATQEIALQHSQPETSDHNAEQLARVIQHLAA
ncbi:MAG: hypothetical protein V3W34_09480 [Phycisphaerae bacterium]